MKKKSTSRRKKLPLLLGALLIISVAAYGTRAYFSDSAKQQANIELELGDVDISTVNTEDWEYTPLTTGSGLDSTKVTNDRLLTKKSSDKSLTDPTKYSNVRPGDSFTREYSIKNTGSLDVKVKIDKENTTLLPTSEDSPVIVEIEGLDDTTILNTTSPTNEQTYTVKITVNPLLSDNYNKGNEDFKQDSFDKLALDYITKTLNFEAIQTNGVQ